ncbi:MAG: hypothetical protein ACI38Y_01670 [Candidatus Methanomethylophilaceae archaeon]
MAQKVDYLIGIAVLALVVVSVAIIVTDQPEDPDLEWGNVPPMIGEGNYIDYVYWDSQGHLVEGTCDGYITMSGTRIIHTTMYTGWYVFDGLDTTQTLSVMGSVNIILKDNSTASEILITDGSSVHFFAVSEADAGTQGSLKLEGDGRICGYNGANVSISIHSGTIDASSVRTNTKGVSTIGAGVNGSATVEIDGGVVKSKSRNDGSAIGGGLNGSCDVTINGGDVEVITIKSGCGIGSGRLGSSTITINGGNVVSIIQHGTGIGSGDIGTTKIEINGGNIRSEGMGAVAIGSGVDGTSTIGIHGGKVYAETSGNAAAIGCSSSMEQYKAGTIGTTIIIDGGEVTAVSNGFGAAIGSGFYSRAWVDIKDGTIVAEGHDLGAAIGSGNMGYADVIIRDGNVSAFNDGQGAAVGSGKRGDVTMSISVEVDASTTGEGWAIGPGVAGKCTMLVGEMRR